MDLERRGDQFTIKLNNVFIRFVEATDGRGPGLSGIDINVSDRKRILTKAEERGALVSEERVDICGVRWYLHDI